MTGTNAQPVQRALRAARSRQRALGRAVRAPGRERDDLLQVAKSAAAAVLAWQVARLVLDSSQKTLADEETGDREVENLRGAMLSGGDKWRDLRSRIQEADVHRRDSLPSYGSLLVDAERILDELERAEDSLAVSTP